MNLQVFYVLGRRNLQVFYEFVSEQGGWYNPDHPELAE